MAADKEGSKCPLDWSAHMLYSMQHLWRAQQLCDLTLVVGTRSFQVHKAYLAAASDYFQAMLTIGMQETYKDTIQLKGVSEVGLEATLEFIYSGKLMLTADNVCDVLVAAAHLQVQPALQYCSSFLESALALDNALDILSVARLYSLENVRRAATHFVQRNLLAIIIGGHHLRMEFDDLKATLTRKDLEFGPEVEIYKCILQWGEYNKESRKHQVVELLNLIRFPLMSEDELRQTLKDFPDSPLTPCIHEALDYHRLPIHQKVLVRSEQVLVRSRHSILAYPSHKFGRSSKDLYALPRAGDRWLMFPDQDCSSYHTYAGSIVAVNNYLIVCGGFYNSTLDTRRDEVTNVCYIFDPRTFSWHTIAPMKTPRASFPLVVCSTGLHALGGLKKVVISTEAHQPRMHGIHTLSIERYSFHDNSWEEVAWLSQATKNHAACFLGAKIYVSGGELEDQRISDQMQCYDTSTKTWTQLEPLSEPVSGHFMFGMKGKVLVIGLDDEYTPMAGFGVEVYNPVTDQWSSLRASNLPRGSEVIPMDGRLFFLNGWKLRNEYDDSTRYIQTVSVKFDGIGFTDYKSHFSYLDVDYPIGAAMRIPVQKMKTAIPQRQVP